MKKMKIELTEVLQIQSVSRNQKQMKKYIKSILKANNINFYHDKKGNILAEKGGDELKPLICAHTDTVHKIVKDFNVYEIDGNILAMDNDFRRLGIGGDDKVGIWAALNLLLNNDSIKVGFFVDEEIGCIGSSNVDENFIDNVSYILQTDRVGNNDFITGWQGENVNADFMKIVKPIMIDFEYEERQQGSVTDSTTIGEKYGINCINLSSGYYLPHTANETVNRSEAKNALNLMQSIIDNVSTKFVYDIEVYEYEDTFDLWNYKADKYDYKNDYEDEYYKNYKCPKCLDKQAFKFTNKDNGISYYCYSCEDYSSELEMISSIES